MRRKLLVGSAVVLALTLGIAAAATAAGTRFNNAALGSRVSNHQDELAVCGTHQLDGYHEYDFMNISKPKTSATIIAISVEGEGSEQARVKVLVDGHQVPPFEFTNEGFDVTNPGDEGATTFVLAQNLAAGAHTLSFRVRFGCIDHWSDTVIY